MTAVALNHQWGFSAQAIPNNLPPQSSWRDTITKIFKNPFFWALNLLAAGAVAVVSAVAMLQPIAAFGVSGLVFSILSIAVAAQSRQTQKELFCEFSMMCNQMVSRFPSISRRPWISQITHSILLSACPLIEHVELLKAQGVAAVLSMVESFEVEPHLFGTPAKPEDWRKAGIHFLNLPNPDLTPVCDEDVERGVEFLHRFISLGQRVLVHCQAGIGRSATIVVCYLIKYRGMNPREAATFVKSKRGIVVNEKSLAVRNFIEKLTQPSSASSRVA